jgi:hypothetical protein
MRFAVKVGSFVLRQSCQPPITSWTFVAHHAVVDRFGPIR